MEDIKEPIIETFNIKLKNKRLQLCPTSVGCMLASKTLTKYTGKGKSAGQKLSKNKKVKIVHINISDETAIGFYYLLKEYLKQ